MFSRISPSRSYDSMDVCNACPLAKSAGAFFPEPGVSSSSRSTFLIGEVNNLRQVSVGLDGIKSKSVVREVLFEKSFSRSSVREVLSVFPKAEIKCDPRFKCRWLLGQCSEIECQKANFSLTNPSPNSRARCFLSFRGDRTQNGSRGHLYPVSAIALCSIKSLICGLNYLLWLSQSRARLSHSHADRHG